MEKINVLLVDDVPANLVALEALIERDDLNIITTTSPNEALRLAWQMEIALALVDVQMPEMDGFELVRLLKSSPRTRDIICIFVTAISKEAKYAVKGLSLGAVDYIYKPLDPLVTNAKLDTFLEIFRQRREILTKNKELQNYALQIDNSSDILAVIDSRSYKITHINPTIKEVLGYEPDKISGMSLLDLLHQEDVEYVSELISKAMEAHDEQLSFEKRFRNTRHEYIWLNVRMVYKHQKLYTSARDMSSTRAFISELVQAREIADESRKSKEKFLANMSHEIRTPIGGIIGLARLLGETNLDEEQQETLGLIKRASDSLLNIINDILDLSKIEAGKFHLESIDFNVKETMQAVVSLLKGKVEEKNLDLRYKIPSNVPKWLIGDPHRLNQILLNLIGNAIKFTTQGYIEIRIKVLEYRQRDQLVEFRVKDTGIGIPKDRLDAIFESFSQASSDTSRKFGGTGLGLTITQKLVELHGGSITVESEVGEGSEFIFTLVCGKSERKQETIEEKVNPFELEGLKGKRILLVDDNKVNRLVGRKTLHRWQTEVSLAEDGQIALNLALEEEFDLILMDLQMPNMNGYEATKAIRRLEGNPNQDVPIIALTAAVLIGEKEKALAAGTNAVQTKPFDPSQLYETMLSLIQAREEGESSPSTSNVDRIDLAYLQKLAGGSKQFVRQYIITFLSNVPSLLDQLDQAYDTTDWNRIRDIAHRLKQEFTYIGHEAAKELLNKIELAAQEGVEAPTTKDYIATMRATTDRAIQELEKELVALQV
ncbi:MAG: response regulator [Bacteroidota bacterium]